MLKPDARKYHPTLACLYAEYRLQINAIQIRNGVSRKSSGGACGLC